MERKKSVRRYGSRRFKKPFAKKFKDFCRNFFAFMFSNVGIIGLVVGYTAAGAFLFQAIETQEEPELVKEMNITRNETARRLFSLLVEGSAIDELTWAVHADIELKNYTWVVTEAIKNGFDGNFETVQNKWNFYVAFLYSLTVITTIGYGNVSPKTPWGKVATILYAIAGMPLFLLYLSNIGDILARCFKWLYAKCCLCRWCPNVAKKREERRRYREAEAMFTPPGTPMPGSPRHGSIDPGNSPNNWQRRHAVTIGLNQIDVQHYPATASSGDDDGEDDESEAVTQVSVEFEEEEEYDSQAITVPVTVCLTIMVGYMFGGALLFAHIEKWDWLDGSYFCFISLTTIGFGDIVPGENTTSKDIMSFIYCSMYLMLGMALIAMCFNLMQEEVIHKIRNIMRVIRRIFR